MRALTFGCVETSPKLPFTQRLLHIYEALGEQLEHCAPDFMSVERLFFGRNITTAEFVWQARGVVMLLAARKGLPVLEPKPNQIKLAVCGTGLDMGPEPDVSMVLFNRFGPTAMRKRLDLTVLLPPGPMKVSAVARPPLSTPAIRISDRVPTPPPIFASAASTRALGILAVQNAFGDW